MGFAKLKFKHINDKEKRPVNIGRVAIVLRNTSNVPAVNVGCKIWAAFFTPEEVKAANDAPQPVEPEGLQGLGPSVITAQDDMHLLVQITGKDLELVEDERRRLFV